MISIIIPAKELEDYLFNSLYNYTMSFTFDYEIIIVFDIYSVNVYSKFKLNFEKNDSVYFLLNPSKGRINALNYGYAHAKGDIIKCIDADDIILNGYFNNLETMANYPVHCHNANLINSNDEIVGTYNFDSNFLFKDYNYVLSNLKSQPRWIWSFNRKIADYIFPIPTELFAEDIWFSLIIKKNCENIFHINNSVYSYRQHPGGEWGGIKNFSPEVMTRRAKWNLALIPILLENKSTLGIVSCNIFSNIVNYYRVFLMERDVSEIFCANTKIYYKMRLFLIMYFPAVASILLSIKWYISKRVIAFKNKKIFCE